MQALGSEVAALNTVHFSKHAAPTQSCFLNRCRQSYGLQAIQRHQIIRGGDHRDLQWIKAELSD